MAELVQSANEPIGARLRYQVCTKTVMDTTDPDITFDENGVCNYWHEFQAFKASLPSAHERRCQLAETIERIKTAGRGKSYDCILGLSGGVDSSYLAYLAKKLELRPLAVHFDNGWNSELAVSNIEKLITALDYDLETFVMDWDEFRDLQRAYFKASVIDLEVPTDHMIFGALHQLAAKHNINYILSGYNYATEWLLPKAWAYEKFDIVNLRSIHRMFGDRPLKRLPALGLWSSTYYRHVRGIKTVNLLDLIDYKKFYAKQCLSKSIDWRDYGGKHYESVFTRFYQGYILPKKFGVDKRKAHLSNLILSGELRREQAIAELQQPTYEEYLQQQDREYVAKKLGFSLEEFAQLLTQPNRRHEEYGTDATHQEFRESLFTVLRPIKRALEQAISTSRLMC